MMNHNVVVVADPPAPGCRSHHVSIKMWRAVGVLFALGAGVLFSTGCTVRTLTLDAVSTDDKPVQNAEVYLNHLYRGRTPLKATFENYGDYAVEIRADGYYVYQDVIKITPPWYGYEPIRLFADLLPFKFTDAHTIRVTLDKRTAVSDQELDALAGELIDAARKKRLAVQDEPSRRK